MVSVVDEDMMTGNEKSGQLQGLLLYLFHYLYTPTTTFPTHSYLSPEMTEFTFEFTTSLVGCDRRLDYKVSPPFTLFCTKHDDFHPHHHLSPHPLYQRTSNLN
jgi:hypothetical protein